MAIAPFGSWKSPITLESLVEQTVGLDFPLATSRFTYWSELRPAEGGRLVLVRQPNQGAGPAEDVFGAAFHVRTLVHEYGGIAYAAHTDDTVYFSNFADQRLYRSGADADEPRPITSAPPSERSVRYASPILTRDGRYLVAVREQHPDPDDPARVVNDVVVLPTDGSREPRVLVDGHDFFGQPALSPDGSRVAWTCWDHPNMPWDGTALWEAELNADMSMRERQLVAGALDESVTQPRYSPDGRLHFVSDRTGWWNLYAADQQGSTNLAPMEADLGEPDWVFGLSSYAFLADGRVLATWSEGGLALLGILLPGTETFMRVDSAFTSFHNLRSAPDGSFVVALAGSSNTPESVVRIAPGQGENAEFEIVKRSRETTVDPRYLSLPEPLEFPTEGGLTAHALYYPPKNADFQAPADERPPLIVCSHGGPTSATSSVLDYEIQFWTSRGFALVDVNYGGSTSYGRAYRERLRGNWGVVDLDDCVNAALFLSKSGRADRQRLVIHGGSAGGYTTLCALTFRDVFATGASYFGVADAGALARETHKFESHYLDSMIGPWPEAQATYEERSPIFHTERLRTPMILFQGLDDKIVPPAQAETMAAALADKGVPYAYVAYEGEQHGFRKAENIRRTSEAELYFYGRVLGFNPADDLEPVRIENESAIIGRAEPNFGTARP